ncbi:hypothetical protein Pcinc_024683 [Petrolisthes cinctipes]|uniref:BZIP domain-containing protein n=1 Tax=Petrolisthes cinctipes TaxID=88211 RepID=A0AAE1FBJ7_PETCI|nr:hypothetical protein Pcinc_024683 [Petrolisthes cinctipes]
MLPCRGLEGSGSQDDAYPPVCFPPTQTTSTSYLSHINETPTLLHPADTSYLSHTTDNPSLASPPLTFSPFPTSDISLSPPQYPSYPPPPYLHATPDTTSFPSPVTSSLTTSHLSVHSPEALTSVAWQESVNASGPIVAWEEVDVVEQTGDTHGRTTTTDGRTTSDRDASTTAVAEGSQGRRPKTYRSRKLKVYEWPRQADPELEQKRLRAVREFRKRQKEDEEERELTNTLHTTRQETRALKEELIRRRQEVEALERQVTGALSQLHASPHYGHSSQS